MANDKLLGGLGLKLRMNHKHVSVKYSWSQLTGMGWRQWQSEHRGHLLQEEDLRPQVSSFLLKIYFFYSAKQQHSSQS